jgi:hypothetical protein
MIGSGREWLEYDDASVAEDMRSLYYNARGSGSVLSLKLASILERHPPKLICEVEYMADRTDDQAGKFAREERQLLKELGNAADKAGIDPTLLYPYRNNLGITKVAPTMSVAKAAADGVDEEFDQTVRILSPKGDESKPIFDLPHSLMKVLGGQALYSLRLYALVPPDKPEAAKAIEQYIRAEVALPWK